MKKAFCLLLALWLLTGAAMASAEEQTADLDLSNASATVIYAQVYNMMVEPEAFLGKIVRLTGYFDYFEDMQRDLVYFSVLIPDATACCAQGIEFVWAGEHDWPDDYPEPGEEITVCGRFDIYQEDGYEYIHLTDAEVTW